MKKVLVGLVMAGLLGAALPASAVLAANHAGGIAKVTICHVAADGSQQTLKVGTPAAKAHLAHHAKDVTGACPARTPQQTSCTFTSSTASYYADAAGTSLVGVGAITFSWRLDTHAVTNGLWHENYYGTFYDYPLTGTVVGDQVTLAFALSAQSSAAMIGALSGATFTAHTYTAGTGPLLHAIGTKTCS